MIFEDLGGAQDAFPLAGPDPQPAAIVEADERPLDHLVSEPAAQRIAGTVNAALAVGLDQGGPRLALRRLITDRARSTARQARSGAPPISNRSEVAPGTGSSLARWQPLMP